jgi:hypothetical protein
MALGTVSIGASSRDARIAAALHFARFIMAVVTCHPHPGLALFPGQRRRPAFSGCLLRLDQRRYQGEASLGAYRHIAGG